MGLFYVWPSVAIQIVNLIDSRKIHQWNGKPFLHVKRRLASSVVISPDS